MPLMPMDEYFMLFGKIKKLRTDGKSWKEIEKLLDIDFSESLEIGGSLS